MANNTKLNQGTTGDLARTIEKGDAKTQVVILDVGGSGTENLGALPILNASEYETVAASQTAQALGATGATGDYLSHVVVFPATTSPGVVTILDNATQWGSFPGGASSCSNLVPFTIPVNSVSVSGAWKITTGLNISCVAVGNFT